MVCCGSNNSNVLNGVISEWLVKYLRRIFKSYL